MTASIWGGIPPQPASVERISLHSFLSSTKISAAQSGSLTVDISTEWETALEYVLSRYADVDAVSLYIPYGRYLLTQNNPLGNWRAANLPGAPAFKLGLTLFGDGYGSQLLWSPSGNSNFWFYDNGDSASIDNSLILFQLSQLFFRFYINAVTAGGKINGFREYGGSGKATQGFVFDRTRFLLVDRTRSDGTPTTSADIAKAGTFLETDGIVNASENVWLKSKLAGWGTVLDIKENVESVDHSFHSTDCELIYGDLFKSAGGGSITTVGGSYTMMSEAEAYFLALRPTTASMAGSYSFSGSRLELNKDIPTDALSYSKLLLLDATAQSSAYNSSFPVIHFSGFNNYPTAGAARDTIKIDAAFPAKVTFDACSLGDIGAAQIHRVNVFTSKATLDDVSDGPYCELTFQNGNAVPHGSVSFTDANSRAIVRAVNCNNTLDYDRTVSSLGQYITKGLQRRLKVAFMKGRQWPDQGDNGSTNKFELNFPKGSILKKVHFRKQAGGASSGGANYQLAAIVGSGAVIGACQSTLADQNVRHEGADDNLMLVMDDALGNVAGKSMTQTIFIAAIGGNTGTPQAIEMAATDFCLVEYY